MNFKEFCPHDVDFRSDSPDIDLRPLLYGYGIYTVADVISINGGTGSSLNLFKNSFYSMPQDEISQKQSGYLIQRSSQEVNFIINENNKNENSSPMLSNSRRILISNIKTLSLIQDPLQNRILHHHSYLGFNELSNVGISSVLEDPIGNQLLVKNNSTMFDKKIEDQIPDKDKPNNIKISDKNTMLQNSLMIEYEKGHKEKDFKKCEINSHLNEDKNISHIDLDIKTEQIEIKQEMMQYDENSGTSFKNISKSLISNIKKEKIENFLDETVQVKSEFVSAPYCMALYNR